MQNLLSQFTEKNTFSINELLINDQKSILYLFCWLHISENVCWNTQIWIWLADLDGFTL